MQRELTPNRWERERERETMAEENQSFWRRKREPSASEELHSSGVLHVLLQKSPNFIQTTKRTKPTSEIKFFRKFPRKGEANNAAPIRTWKRKKMAIIKGNKQNPPRDTQRPCLTFTNQWEPTSKQSQQQQHGSANNARKSGNRERRNEWEIV